MRTRFAAAAMAAIALAATGCAPETGTVVDRRVGYVAPANGQHARNDYFVTVKGPDGTTGESPVSAAAYKSCTPGKQWPDCKRK